MVEITILGLSSLADSTTGSGLGSESATTLVPLAGAVKSSYIIATCGSITNYINNNELKKINIKKEIKPITYQIKDKCSILVGDYIRLDFECISTSITIYISNNVPVKRISINNPILLDNIISSYNDLKNKDIIIEDICFIKITKNTRVNIYGKYNLSTIIRDNLI